MRKNRKLRIRIFGKVFDSESLSAKGVETLGQKALEDFSPGCFRLEVSEFDFMHIKFRLYRSYYDPRDIDELIATDPSNYVIQDDKQLLFPELPTVSSWGGYFNITEGCKDIVDELNIHRLSYKGSVIKTLSAYTTRDYIDVEISK